MKVKRYKKIRKIFHFYKINFNIQPPFKVALDAEYIQACLEGKIQIKEQLPKVLQHEQSTPYVTRCVLHTLEQKGKHYSGASMIAKTLAFLKCRHKKGLFPDIDCIKHLIEGGNPDRLCVGAQSIELRKHVRNTPGVPLLFIRGNVPIVETPSAMNRETIKTKAQEIEKPAPAEKAMVQKLQDEAKIAAGADAVNKTKRKRAKGPNPLSVKKKKTKVLDGTADSDGKKVSTAVATGQSTSQSAAASTPSAAPVNGKRKRPAADVPAAAAADTHSDPMVMAEPGNGSRSNDLPAVDGSAQPPGAADANTTSSSTGRKRKRRRRKAAGSADSAVAGDTAPRTVDGVDDGGGSGDDAA